MQQVNIKSMWRPWQSSANAISSYAKHSRKHLSSDAKVIVKNVCESLLKSGHPKVIAIKNTSEMTKVPLSTVRDIMLKGHFKRKVRKDTGKMKCVDDCDKDVIRRKIYQMYQENVVPTLDSLKTRLTTDDTTISCSRTSLHRALQEMGFKYKTINKRQIIMESERFRQMRSLYLREIKKFRSEKRSIVYLDETWFDTHDTVKKGWVDLSEKCQSKAPSNKGKRITIIGRKWVTLYCDCHPIIVFLTLLNTCGIKLNRKLELKIAHLLLVAV